MEKQQQLTNSTENANLFDDQKMKSYCKHLLLFFFFYKG